MACQAIRGGRFIDATGDGDLAALAGAAFQLGEGEPPVLQPGTLRFYWKDFHLEDIDRRQVEESFRQGLEAGEIRRADYWSLEGRPTRSSMPTATTSTTFRSTGPIA